MKKIYFLIAFIAVGYLLQGQTPNQFIGAPNKSVLAQGGFMADSFLRLPVKAITWTPTKPGYVTVNPADSLPYNFRGRNSSDWVRQLYFGDTINVIATQTYVNSHGAVTTRDRFGFPAEDTRFSENRYVSGRNLYTETHDSTIVIDKGTFSSGLTLTETGNGAKMFFYPKKAAFRAGRVTGGTDFDDANIGDYSVLFGTGIVTGAGSGNFGNDNYSIGGSENFIFGFKDTINGTNSVQNVVFGDQNKTTTSNGNLVSGANNTLNLAYYSVTDGYQLMTSGSYNTNQGVGNDVHASIASAHGASLIVNQDYSNVFGLYNDTSNTYKKLLEAGWGSSNAARKDVFFVDTSGKLFASYLLNSSNHKFLFPPETFNDTVAVRGSIMGIVYSHLDTTKRSLYFDALPGFIIPNDSTISMRRAGPTNNGYFHQDDFNYFLLRAKRFGIEDDTLRENRAIAGNSGGTGYNLAFNNFQNLNFIAGGAGAGTHSIVFAANDTVGATGNVISLLAMPNNFFIGGLTLSVGAATEGFMVWDSVAKRVKYRIISISGGTVNTGTANTLAYYPSTGTTVDDLAAITANRALISDANGLPTHSATTATELGYSSGVTSAIQTQLNGKQASNSNLTTIAGLTPTNDDVMQYKSGAWANRTMAQLKTDLVLVKGDVGLGNVDNTSDATKNAASVTLTNHTINNTNTVTLKDNLFTLQDDGDVTKQFQIQVSSVGTGTTKTWIVPNANSTFVGTDATQTLTNKTIDASSNTITNITEAMMSFSDVTTLNSSTTQHGFLKKLDNNAAHYMDGTGNWSTPAGGGGGGYATVKEEGGTSLTARTILNFVGSGITATDNSGSGWTDITINAQLNSLASLATNGILVRSAANTIIARSFTNGIGTTAVQGDGVSGNMSVNLTGVDDIGTGTVQTSNATVTSVMTVNMPADASGLMVVNMVATKTDNTKSLVGTKYVYWHSSGSTVTIDLLVDWMSDYLRSFTTATWTVDASTNTIRFRATGEAATTIDWNVSYTVKQNSYAF